MGFKFDISGGFASLSNRAVRDNRISLKAKGLLLLIVSKPDGWQFAADRLQEDSRDGLDSVKAGLRELESAGYLLRVPRKDERGRLAGYDYYTNGGNPIEASAIEGISIGGLSIDGFSFEGKPSDLINKEEARKIGVKKEKERDTYTPLDTEVSIPPASDEGSGRDAVPYQKIVDAYNATCTSLPKCTTLSAKRRKAVNACWKEFGDKVYDAFRAAAESDFLSGRSGAWSGCGFDWLTRVNNMLKVIEGTYANKNGKAQVDAVRRNPMARDYTGQYDGDEWEVV